MVSCYSLFIYWCCYSKSTLKWAPEVFEKLWLVGAFSDFGRADTGNPVQILGYFAILVLSPGN